MDERALIDQFNSDVDQLLERGWTERSSLSEEYDDLIELVETLAVSDYSEISLIKNTLRGDLIRQIEKGKFFTSSRLQEGIETSSEKSKRKIQLRFGYFFILLVAILLLVLTVPPIRSVAQEIVHFLENMIFVNEPTFSERFIEDWEQGPPYPTLYPNLNCLDCEEPVPMSRLTIDEASTDVGFRVYVPTYMPSGYWLEARDVVPYDQSTNVTEVVSIYAIQLAPEPFSLKRLGPFQPFGYIHIHQTHFSEDSQPFRFNIGETPIVEVTVRGLPGVWLEQLPSSPYELEPGEWESYRSNILIWEEGGFQFRINTNMPLPWETMIKVAESLTNEDRPIVPTHTPIGDYTQDPRKILEIEESSNLIGFDVYSPSYIPFWYTILSRDVIIQGSSKYIETTYLFNNEDYPKRSATLSFGQSPLGFNIPLSKYFLGDTPSVDVDVSGNKGVWYDWVATEPFVHEKWNPYFHLLTWEDSDFKFWILSNEENDIILRIAESLYE